MLIRTPSIILVGNDMLGMRARMWRDEDTIYFYLCAFDHRLCVYEDVLKEMCFKVTFYARARPYAYVQNTCSDEYTFSAKEEEAVVLRVF